MFERFTDEARTIVVHAQQHARRLGHRFIGCEHLLLALAGSEQPVGAVLCGLGITPDEIEKEIVRRVGLGSGAGLFADLDQDALAAIGIDVDAVRAHVEARFSSDALSRADQRVHRWPHRRRHRGPAARLARQWRRLRTGRRKTREPRQAWTAPASGRFSTFGPAPSGHLPFTARAKKTLDSAVRQAVAGHDTHIGAEHIALGLLDTNSGMVPHIVSTLGTSPPALNAAIRDRYRRAS